MKIPELKGIGTALVTPFIDGEVDYEAYAALVDRQVEAGVDFFVALATTAETPTLSPEEKIALLRLTHGHAGGRPIVVGCGSNSVAGTVANMRLLEAYDVDAWLVVVPFYNKPTQEGMFQYYKAVCEATDKPVIVYNVPGRTGVNMTAATCLRIAREIPGIIGIKEASGKIDQVYEILDGAPEGFVVLSGDDDLTLAMMKHGAAGAVSVASNMYPAELKEMTAAALEGRFDDAERVDVRLQPLYKACFVESSPVPVKSGLNLMGLCTKEMRLPLTEASDSTVELMRNFIQAF